MTSPVWTTPAGFLGTLTERKTTATNLSVTGTSITYSVVSGQLPVGLYLNTSTGQILGTPVSVPTVTSSTFVVRAKNIDGVKDRTFSYNVDGPDAPVWVTLSGRLPVGLNGEYYTINKEYVDYTLRADTDILSSGNSLKYYLVDGLGELPPGLRLSTDGRITGYVSDQLDIAVTAQVSGGYDTEAYDFFPFEHGVFDQTLVDENLYIKSYNVRLITQEQPTRIILNEPYDLQDGNQVFINDVEGMTQLNGNTYYIKTVSKTSFALYTNPGLTEGLNSVAFSPYTGSGTVYWGSRILVNPKSINRNYRFTIAVTDGIISSQRTFTIEVVSPDNLRVDNGILSIDADYYDASASYLLSPIWQTKYGAKLPKAHNLGSVRAGKNQVLQLYEYDPYPLDGPVYFDWLTAKVNPDIKLYTDNQIGEAHLSLKNRKGDFTLYYKNAEIAPVKGMQIQLNEYIAGVDATVYTITGVTKTSDTSGIIFLDQPLAQLLPDSRLFYAGTKSTHPDGINLDSNTGILYGRIPYQPAYSNSYRFTVKTYKLDLSTADTTIYTATNSNDGKIVGKIYTTTSTQYVPSVLPSIAAYTGDIGDILLVSIAAPVDYPAYLTKMDGTSYAYVYSPTLYTVDQYSANTTGTNITLNTGVTPQTGWVLSRGSVIRTITTVTDSGGYFTVGVDSSVPANDNSPAVVWTLGDTSIDCWSYIGETVASPQVYILNVLGEVPSAITWISTSSLGTLNHGEISELAVKAQNTNTDYAIQYDIIQGELPPGLTLSADGSIIGKVTGSGQTYFDYTNTTATCVGSISNNVLTINTITTGEVVAHQIITTNEINYTIYNTVVSGDVDYVTFTTGDQPIPSLYLTKYVSLDNKAWFAIQEGSSWTAPQDAITDELVAYGHFGPTTTLVEGTNVLESFSPLNANTTYTMWIQQTGVNSTEYAFSTNQYDIGGTRLTDYSSNPEAPTLIEGLEFTLSVIRGSGSSWEVFNEFIPSVTKTTSTFYATTISPGAFESDITFIDNGNTTVDRNWYFTIRASDAYRLSAIEKEFYITVYRDSLSEYTQIYVKPFLPVEKRASYRNFVTDPTIFDPALIYRPADPNFGIQQQIKMIIEADIEQVDINLYSQAMSQYFYRKKFFFGEVKSVLAQDSSGNEVYEIVYVEIIDNLMNGTATPTSATSVINMQLQLESIELESGSIISTNERLLPKYMTTINTDTGVPLGFVKAVPLCYTLPGAAVKFLSKINNAIKTGKFNFNNYHFDTDRIIIESSKETGEPAWILYPTDRR